MAITKPRFLVATITKSARNVMSITTGLSRCRPSQTMAYFGGALRGDKLWKAGLPKPPPYCRACLSLWRYSCSQGRHLIDGRPRSASVFAIRDCELRFVGRNAFEECIAQHPEIYRYLVNVLAARLRETNEVVAAANFLTVEARLARALLDLAQHFRGHSEAEQIVISHKMTQSDLAAMAGVARENVSRVLMDWKERKIVVRSSGYYCLYDVAALKRKGSA